ncbi:MAG: DUF3352 domain-containing protein [Gaiella sp.]|nr:DUF3352 domain-containing protein [Gaiella sp.]
MTRRALPIACLLAVVALVTGCAGASSTPAAIPDSASLAPADALAYVTVTTDEGSDQWKKAESLLERIPGAGEGISGSIGSALGEQGLDWTKDVAPALGSELVVVATAAKQPIVLVRPEDEQKLDALVAQSDTPLVRGTVEDWQVLAQDQAALDAYRAALDKGTLEGVDTFSQGFGALPSDAIARAWVDTARLAKDLGQLVPQGSGSPELDLGLDWLSAAVSARDDGALLTVAMRTPGGGDTRYEPELFQRVPADAVAALSFGGTQGLLDRLQGKAPLDEVSGEIERLTGVSLQGIVDALSGEGALYVRQSGTTVPEVTLALRPPDPSKTWDTVEGLARKLAEQGGATVTVRTENGIEVRRVTLDDVTVSYARPSDDTIILTTGADGIRTFLASGPKLVDADAYTRAAEAVSMGERTRGFLYVDVDGLLPLAEAAGGEIPPEVDDALGAVDSFILEGTGEGDTTQLAGFLRLND